MIHAGILFGGVSYIIFFLGVNGMLYRPLVQIIGLLICCTFGIYYGKRIFQQFLYFYYESKKTKISITLSLILLVQTTINLIGVIGPEIGFDALWYHLTLPKIYLDTHQISYIPGGLLYYSVMPKLGEMLYVIGLSLGSEVFPKLIHYIFGILSIVVTYKTLRLCVSPLYALIGGLIFYTSLVVGWESTSAYIDLIRTFYEVLALYCFVLWYKQKEEKMLWLSAIMVGFATATKLLALGSLGIFILLIIFLSFKKDSLLKAVKRISVFFVITLSIPFVWFVFSYIHTGNPVYPFFTSTYPVSASEALFLPVTFFFDLSSLLLFSPDPISPLYMMFVPLSIYFYKRFPGEIKIIALYSLFALVIWYFTPRTGGGRFILPYLPAWSMLIGYIIYQFDQRKEWKNYLLILVISVSLISIGYRLIANSKYLPYIIGKETKAEFLQKHFNFSFGDFYDIDGYFAKTINKDDTVLLYGFHNLYYIDFPFIHSSWVNKGDRFNYIATQMADIPSRYRNWKKIYTNPHTNVSLYTHDKKMETY